MITSAGYQVYAINFPRFFILRDAPREDEEYRGLLLHLSQGDYLSTLASIMRFFEETISGKEVSPEMQAAQLKALRSQIKNLLYLNKNYKLVPKDRYESLHKEK